MNSLALLNLGPTEIIVLLILALLIFGSRLPQVGKNLGKGIVEFKKGLAGVEDEVKKAGQATSSDMSNGKPEPTAVKGQLTDARQAEVEAELKAAQDRVAQLQKQLHQG